MSPPLLNLPVETMNQICGHFCRHCSERRLDPTAHPDRGDFYPSLLALCLTSRALRALAQPLLYHYIEFSGQHNHNPLFPLLRTLSFRPDLAASIRSVKFDGIDCVKEISSCIHSLDSHHGSPAANNLPLVLQRMSDTARRCNICVPVAWEEGFRHDRFLTPGFLQQLVLLHASNVEYMHLCNGAEVVATNLFFPADPSRPSHSLEKLQVLSVDEKQNSISVILVGDRAPRLHTIHATDLGYYDVITAKPIRLSKVVNLYLDKCHFIRDLLSLHASLENLGIGAAGTPGFIKSVLVHLEMRRLLHILKEKQRHSLRALGIVFQCTPGCFDPDEYRETTALDFLGLCDTDQGPNHPLRECINLEVLPILELGLIKHYVPNLDSTFIPFALVDILPSSIEQLHIFHSNGFLLVDEFEELLENGVKKGMYPNLREIRSPMPSLNRRGPINPLAERWNGLVAEYGRLGVTLRRGPKLLQEIVG